MLIISARSQFEGTFAEMACIKKCSIYPMVFDFVIMIMYSNRKTNGGSALAVEQVQVYTHDSQDHGGPCSITFHFHIRYL